MADSSAVSWSDRALDVILEYLQAADAGHPPDARSVLAAHPELAEELCAFFADQEAVVRQVQPVRVMLRGAGQDALPSNSQPVQIAGYELREQIGQGGMGTVYRAWQQGAEREVAVKVLRTGAMTGGERERFLFEARSVAGLEHPNIVRIYEVGIAGDEPFFSMELAASTLAGRIDELRGKPLLSAELLRTLARAMDFAHRRGILHRDLKPANILLAGDGTPKVADFGLAKRLTPHESAGEKAPRTHAIHEPDTHRDPLVPTQADTAPYEQASDPTRTGTIIGTPSYMAPEQTRAEKVLTVTTDVYSLGAILYQCLTGQPPFRAATITETLRQVREEAPLAPRSIDAKIDKNLEAICLNCLKKEPAERYADAAQLADDLDRFLRWLPTRARRMPLRERMRLRVRRQPLTAALTAVVCLLAVLVLAGLGWQIRSIVVQREEDKATLYVRAVALADRDIKKGQLDQANEMLASCPEAMRGWDWDYLRRVCLATRLRLVGHERLVLSVCYDPQGKRLLTGSKDGTARLWDAITGQQLQCWAGHQGSVTACFTVAGRQVVTAGKDQNVRIRETETGRQVWELPNAGELVVGDQQGRYLAAAGRSRWLRIYDLPKRKLLWQEKLKHEIICLAMDRNGGQMAAACYDGPIRVWQVASGHELPSLPSRGRSWALTFSRDGNHLVAGQAQPVLWDLHKRERIRTFSGSGSWYCAGLDLSPDGTLLAAPYRDGRVRVWEVDSGLSKLTPVQAPSEVFAAAFSPDGSALAITWGRTVTIQTIDVQRLEAEACRERKDHRHRDLEAVVFSEDGRWLASRSGDGEVILDEVKRQPRHPPRRFTADKGKALAFYRDSDEVTWLLAGGRNHLRAWRADTGASGSPAGLLLPGTAELVAAAPGIRLASASRLAVFTAGSEIQSGGDTWSPGSEVLALAHQPGRECVAAAGTDGRIRLWDRADNQQSSFAAHRGSATALAFSHDGRLLATGGADMTVYLWDVRRPTRPLHVLRGHGGCLTGVAFTPDGRRLASCGNDGWIKIWDTRTGSELLTLSKHAGQVSAVAFSPDGRLLASCGHDGAVRLWDGRPVESLQEELSR